MAANPTVARGLAEAFLAGAWEARELARRGRAALGSRDRWIERVARRVVSSSAEPLPNASDLTQVILTDAGFLRASREASPPLQIRRWILASPAMAPAPGPPSEWETPHLPTAGELGLWLGLTATRLSWFADVRGLERAASLGPLRHYRYRWLAKRSGDYRLVEAPKPRLKALQRRLLRELLTAAPAHEACHGFRQGRSPLTFARPHAGSTVVLRMDLRDFFASVTAARVRAILRTMGYPDEVARLITGLCTNRVPADVWHGGPPAANPQHARRRAAARRLYASAHLPAGAPTSPYLANLCAFGLDVRLAALAEASGARYTRYADDLAFSGGPELARGVDRFREMVIRITADEGFHVHPDKSRTMRQGVRQCLAGIVVNAHPNLRRDDYDRLKAILHNCARSGPEEQNRANLPDFRAHLLGRIAWLESLNPSRGRRLRAMLSSIDWGVP